MLENTLLEESVFLLPLLEGYISDLDSLGKYEMEHSKKQLSLETIIYSFLKEYAKLPKIPFQQSQCSSSCQQNCVSVCISQMQPVDQCQNSCSSSCQQSCATTVAQPVSKFDNF